MFGKNPSKRNILRRRSAPVLRRRARGGLRGPQAPWAWGLALVLALPASTAAAQATPADPFVRCTKCSNRGARPCPEHERGACELEGNVVYCSRIGVCGRCGGVGWLDCPRCENPAVEGRLAEKRARVPDLARGLAGFAEDLGRPVPVAESAHFVVVFDVERLKVDRKLVDGHVLLHRYVDALERLYADYTAILGVAESAFAKKCRVLVWSNILEHREAAARYCRMAANGGVRLMGAEPVYSVPADKRLFATEEALRRNVIHCATHLLLSHEEPSHWVGKSKGGWADAGLAHWFEERYFGICDNYCYQESDTSPGVRRGAWKPWVRKMVARDTAPSLAGLFQQNTETLSREQHAVAFALVDYLIQLDGRKLDRVFVRLRQRVSTRDALAEVFETTPLRLEADWRAWVLETYPTR